MTEKDEDPARPADHPARRSSATEPREPHALPADFRARDVCTVGVPNDLEVSRSPEEARTKGTPAHGVNDPGILLGKLAWRFEGVEAQLAEFHRLSAHRKAVIYRLHEENQRFRGGITVR